MTQTRIPAQPSDTAPSQPLEDRPVGQVATAIGITIAGIRARGVPRPDAVRPTGEPALQTKR